MALMISITSLPIKFLFRAQTETHWKVTSNICRKRRTSFAVQIPIFPMALEFSVFAIADVSS